MKLKQIPEDFIVKEIPDYNTQNGPYAIFLLKKKNYTTERAIQKICGALHIKRNRVGYAGIKDRHAVTQQYISILKISKDRVEQLDLDDLELEFVAYSNSSISLGMLKGNEFEIVIRNLKKGFKINKNEKIKNYFDKQRFSNNNSAVGLALLKKDFKKAVNLILENEGDYEDKMKSFLKDNSNNYVGALSKVPHKILLLFIHAYQSEIYNKTILHLDSNKNILVPIVGFGTDFKDEKIKKLVSELLKKDGLTQRDFIIHQIRGLTCFGEERSLYVVPKKLKLGTLETDELNKGKYKLKISFYLPKGAYATNVVSALVN